MDTQISAPSDFGLPSAGTSAGYALPSAEKGTPVAQSSVRPSGDCGLPSIGPSADCALPSVPPQAGPVPGGTRAKTRAGSCVCNAEATERRKSADITGCCQGGPPRESCASAPARRSLGDGTDPDDSVCTAAGAGTCSCTAAASGASSHSVSSNGAGELPSRDAGGWGGHTCRTGSPRGPSHVGPDEGAAQRLPARTVRGTRYLGKGNGTVEEEEVFEKGVSGEEQEEELRGPALDRVTWQGEVTWRAQPPEGNQLAEGIVGTDQLPGVPGRERAVPVPGKSSPLRVGGEVGMGPAAISGPSLGGESTPWLVSSTLDVRQITRFGGSTVDLGPPEVPGARGASDAADCSLGTSADRSRHAAVTWGSPSGDCSLREDLGDCGSPGALQGPAGTRPEMVEAGRAAHVGQVVDEWGSLGEESMASSAVLFETRDTGGTSPEDAVSSSSDGRQVTISTADDSGGVKRLSETTRIGQVAEEVGSLDSDTWKQARDAATLLTLPRDMVSCSGSNLSSGRSVAPRPVGHSLMDQGLVVVVQVTVLLSLSLLLWRGLAALAVDLFLV